MKNGNFQLIIIVVFIVAAIFGLLVFSGVIPLGSDSKNTVQGTVTLWGTASMDQVSSLIETFNTANKNFTVKYIQKYPETFDQDLLEALASGNGPDMFFLTDNLAYKYSNKIYKIPYQSYPIATFKNTFTGAGEIFLTSKGMLAFPLSVDPMMLYYNRSIFDANNVIYPPATWDDVVSLTPTLTKRETSGRITQSAVAMGQFTNISHAKDILATLFLQTGSSIVQETNGGFVSTLVGNSDSINLQKSLSFYTGFTDPLSSVYSWNKSFPNSLDSFSAEKLAMYFGYASELKSIVNKNPNENFMVAPMPQIKGTKVKITSAHVTGIAVSSFSKNFNTAFTAASLMATGDFASGYADATGTMPARRDLLAKQKTDSFSPIFYSSALFAKGWLDPSSNDSDNIFRVMIENVLSGKMTTENAVNDAGAKLNLLFNK